MKKPEEIKKGLVEAVAEMFWATKDGDDNAMRRACGMAHTSMADALAYIQHLEAERDAAVSELVGTCQVCRWEGTAKCASCHFCTDAWNVHDSNWEWRSVQKEE